MSSPLWLCISVVAAGLMTGCARYHSEPLNTAQLAEQLESRSLTNAALKEFVLQQSSMRGSVWPLAQWDEQSLVLAALFYNPDLRLARAQWSVARGGEEAAAQRPNPSVTATPLYNTTTASPSPWGPAMVLDVPLETAGKRGLRRAQAAHLSEAARLNVAVTAWQVRGGVRAALVDWAGARQRLELLQCQVGFQEQLFECLQQLQQAGGVAASELVPHELALQKARQDWLDAQRQEVEARSHLAEAIGVPVGALERISIRFALEGPLPGTEELASAPLRRAALVGRADVLEALAEYQAAELALELEIAKQYPDIHLQPGYQYDQGQDKWSLGVSAELPILDHNQGGIAEAKAKRREAAFRFEAVQARVLAELERTRAAFDTAQAAAKNLQAQVVLQQRQSAVTDAQARAGAADRTDRLGAQVELLAARLARVDGLIKLQQAFGALEDAVRQPLDPNATLYSSGH